MKNRILIIDSGVGGLSVFEHIWKMTNACEFIYCADNACFPYGTKPEPALNDRLETLVGSLVSRHKPDIIVIACNTASTTALETIRRKTHIPVVGVVPAIKPAAQITKSGYIALLATSTTLNSHYTDCLIRDWASEHQVVKLACDALVQIAEDKLAGIPVEPVLLNEVIEKAFRKYQQTSTAEQIFSLQKIDTAVLACTHFPLLTPELASALPFVSQWVDSGDAIGRRVCSLLQKTDTHSGNAVEMNTATFLYTKKNADLHKLDSALSKMGFSNIRLHDIE